MIGSGDEVSVVIAMVQVVFAVVLIPTLMDGRAYIPRSSSGLTVVASMVLAGCFFDLGLMVAGIVEIMSGMVWFILFVFRGIRVKSVGDGKG